jgi:hypothetical protein
LLARNDRLTVVPVDDEVIIPINTSFSDHGLNFIDLIYLEDFETGTVKQMTTCNTIVKCNFKANLNLSGCGPDPVNGSIQNYGISYSSDCKVNNVIIFKSL